MENLLLNTFLRSALFGTVILFSSLSVAGSALTLSGPSQAVAGDTVLMSGTAFSAAASYTVETIINNQRSHEVVNTDNSGRLQYQLVTTSVGTYQLNVRDSDNNLVATSMVVVRTAGE